MCRLCFIDHCRNQKDAYFLSFKFSSKHENHKNNSQLFSESLKLYEIARPSPTHCITSPSLFASRTNISGRKRHAVSHHDSNNSEFCTLIHTADLCPEERQHVPPEVSKPTYQTARRSRPRDNTKICTRLNASVVSV